MKKHHSLQIGVLTMLVMVLMGQLVYLNSPPTITPAQAQTRTDSCDPSACAAIGGECAANRAECDRNGMIPITCDVTTNPTTGQKMCTLLGGKNAGDPVCCKNIWGWREQGKDSCSVFKSPSECQLATDTGIHSCCWTDPVGCLSTTNPQSRCPIVTKNPNPQRAIVTLTPSFKPGKNLPKPGIIRQIEQ